MAAISHPVHPARRLDPIRMDRDRRRFARGAPRDDLVERFLPLARQLALRYTRGGEPFDDLFQVACIGLLKAVDRYDPARGTAFSSFAVPTILGEIKRYYRDRTWIVHVPRDLLELAMRVEQAASAEDRPPTHAELAARLEVTEDAVRDAAAAGRTRWTVSMDQPRLGQDGEDATLADAVGVEDRGFTSAEARATLASLMRCLTPRDREIVRLRYAEDLTQHEIGARVDLSQMQVSRVLRSAIGRLQQHAQAQA